MATHSLHLTLLSIGTNPTLAEFEGEKKPTQFYFEHVIYRAVCCQWVKTKEADVCNYHLDTSHYYWPNGGSRISVCRDKAWTGRSPKHDEEPVHFLGTALVPMSKALNPQLLRLPIPVLLTHSYQWVSKESSLCMSIFMTCVCVCICVLHVQRQNACPLCHFLPKPLLFYISIGPGDKISNHNMQMTHNYTSQCTLYDFYSAPVYLSSW